MGLGPAIHDFTDRAKDVDGRHEGGHDETTVGQYSLKYLTRAQPDSREFESVCGQVRHPKYYSSRDLIARRP